VALLRVAVARAPEDEAEYLYEEEQVEAELNLAVDQVLRGICESVLNPIHVAFVQFVEAILVLPSSTFLSNWLCLLWLLFLTAVETNPRPQSAVRKLYYRG
jgi:hypothetical protein